MTQTRTRISAFNENYFSFLKIVRLTFCQCKCVCLCVYICTAEKSITNWEQLFHWIIKNNKTLHTFLIVSYQIHNNDPSAALKHICIAPFKLFIIIS